MNIKMINRILKPWVRALTTCVLFTLILCDDVKLESDHCKIGEFSKYLGKGYDIVLGYTLPNNEFLIDPGFKESIFHTDNSINIISEDTCQKDEYFSFIESVNDIEKLTINNVTIDDVNTSVRPFSGSVPYKVFFSDLEVQKKKFLMSQSTCLICYASYNLKESYQTINKDFLKDSDNLPILSNNIDRKGNCPTELFSRDPDSINCINTVKPWINFFDKYGTHVLSSAHFGGQTLNTLEVPLDVLEKIKFYKHKFYIRNIPYLNVFNFPKILQDIWKVENKHRTIHNANSTLTNKNESLISTINNNENMFLKKKSINESRGSMLSNNGYTVTLDVKGGIKLDNDWNEDGYNVWKSSVYNNMVPVNLDLISLSTFMNIKIKNSYNTALLYYNNLFTINEKNYFLSQNIVDIYADGKYVTKSGKGSLSLICPVGYIKSTGFIFSFDPSYIDEEDENRDSTVDKKSRIQIISCPNTGDYDVSCNYTNQNDNNLSFGWMYCVKHKLAIFETVHTEHHHSLHKKKKSNKGKKKNLQIKCSSGNALGFGFKIELGKDDKLSKMNVQPCDIGTEKCVMQREDADTDYLMWGFCTPSTFNGTTSLELKYISKTNITKDVSAACTDNYENQEDNIFLGFSFSFDNGQHDINVNSCGMKSKTCLNKLKNDNEKIKHTKRHYAGTFLLCKYDGGIQRNFVHV